MNQRAHEHCEEENGMYHIITSDPKVIPQDPGVETRNIKVCSLMRLLKSSWDVKEVRVHLTPSYVVS